MENNLKDDVLGAKLNPVSNICELKEVILRRRNCYIYTKGTFKITEENLCELKIRNIKLVGGSVCLSFKGIRKSSFEWYKRYIS